MLVKVSGNKKILRVVGSTLTKEKTALALLRENVSGAAIIDLTPGNVLLTDDQASKGLLLVLGGNGSKKITYPSSAIGKIPLQVAVLGFNSAGSFIVEMQGGQSVTVEAGDNTEIIVAASLGAVGAANLLYSIYSNSKYNERKTSSALSRDLAKADAGSLLVMTNASANTVLVKAFATTGMKGLSKGWIRAGGAAGTTIQGDTGVVINGVAAGSLAIAANRVKLRPRDLSAIATALADELEQRGTHE